MKIMTTYRFRIKDTNSRAYLNKMASSVNFVWNYCNETSFNYIRNKSKFLSGFELSNLTKGCSKELGLSSTTIQCIGEEYAIKRRRSNKTKLSWRSEKRNLGWIPAKADGIKLKDDTVKYAGRTFRFWKSREILGKTKTANFSQDARRRWYINIQCEIEKHHLQKTGKEIGIDLGLKTIASDSSGNKYERENITKKYEDKLAMAQRANKKRLTRTIFSKIKNTRKDWAHKTTTNIVKDNDLIVIGNVSSSKLQQTKLAKSISDASWYQFKSLLAYKAIKLGKECIEVKENFSTVTCSSCLNKTGVSGLSNLGVREWTCSICETVHDRDTNAARNILRFGHESLKGIPLPKLREDVKCGYYLNSKEKKMNLEAGKEKENTNIETKQ